MLIIQIRLTYDCFVASVSVSSLATGSSCFTDSVSTSALATGSSCVGISKLSVSGLPRFESGSVRIVLNFDSGDSFTIFSSWSYYVHCFITNHNMTMYYSLSCLIWCFEIKFFHYKTLQTSR